MTASEDSSYTQVCLEQVLSCCYWTVFICGIFFSPLKSKLIIQQTNRPFYLILIFFFILCEYDFYEHLSVVGDVVDMLKVLKVLRNNVTSPAFALLSVIMSKMFVFSV